MSAATISQVMREMGRKGGQVRSPKKARTHEQARAAALARWAKAKAAKAA